MKILIITNLFPNSQESTRGIFNFQQFKALREQEVVIKVVAPIPWHHFSKMPFRETIDGFDVYHPRYFIIPKITRALYGLFFFISIFKTVKRLCDEFKPDAILATWAYPDAIGSFLCVKILKKPFFVKVHGSDINLYVKHPLRRAQITYALSRSSKVIAVSSALKQRLVEICVPAEKIAVIPNGVDMDLFKPLDQIECRKKLGLPLDKKIILYVGNFAQVKGVDILVDAFGELTRLRNDILLVLVGAGSLDKMLCEKVKTLGIEQNIIFAGRTPHDSIRYYMNACDVFCLPSRDEGCPNVVLEAMACGKPVVGSDVGGIPELITSTELGILTKPSDSESLSCALKEAINKQWDSVTIRNSIAKFNWEESALMLKKALEEAL